MIVGTVTSLREGIIGLSLQGPTAQQDIEAVVDTGFNGWLTLSPALVNALGLPWQSYGRATLADGSESLFNIHEATVIWDGLALVVPVDAVDCSPLVGMSLLDRYELNMQVRLGGSVTIRALP